jgi:nicotinate-nucleotide adenylyltransferase
MSAPLGVFGGTFDPVHYGHLRLARTALQTLGLASVRWIPSGCPGHREAPRASAAHRLAMLRLALAAQPDFTLDDAELHSGAPGYTIDTLTRLRAELGDELPLVFLIGADQFLGFTQWREWRRLFELAHFGVAERPGYAVSPSAMPPALAQQYAQRKAGAAELRSRASGRICLFSMAPLDISSTSVREAIAVGRPPHGALPADVLDYIASNGLYQERASSS